MRKNRLPVLVLLVTAPVCAEYLVGYDDSVGHPLRLLAGLLVLAPLYGVPALLIRELARRRGLGWTGVLLLAAAAGLLQAGVVDQTLFAVRMPGIPYWDDLVRPTFVPALGLSVANVLGFVGGHVVWSFAVPVAVAERVRPASADRGWLTWPWVVAAVLLWAAAAGLIASESAYASPAQRGWSLAVVAVLVLAALFSRPVGFRGSRSPLVVAAAGLVAGGLVNLSPATWPGTVVVLAAFAAAAVLARRWVATPHHVLALAGGACVARAATGFLAPTVSDAPGALVLGQHVLALVLSLALVAWGTRGRTRGQVPAPAATPGR